MDWPLINSGFIAALACTALGTWPLLLVLRRRAILDRPNERSSHTSPTPKGGGLVLIPVLGLGWILAASNMPGWNMTEVTVIVLLSLFLGVVSWLDDLRSLSAKFRLITHAAAATIGIAIMPGDALVFQGLLDPLVDKVLAALLWIWFINLFNFMDGIDGISGIEALSIGIGIMAIGSFADHLVGYAPLAAILVGATLGFLVWNWHPARIFLGDVGSVPLGFLLGWLLLSLAASGEWLAALILPAYYLSDATITLIRRVVRGERAWIAHREHFYQKATSAALSHRQASMIVLIANMALVSCAIAVINGKPVIGATFAGIVIGLVLIYFSTRPPLDPHKKTTKQDP